MYAVPIRVVGLPEIVAIAAGANQSFALDAAGAIWAWGNNSDGSLGTGTFTSTARPMRAVGLPPVVALGSGLHHTLAVADDGSVWAWGLNSSGQLGHDAYGRVPEPRQVALPGEAVSVAGGAHYSLALTTDGTVWAWGDHGIKAPVAGDADARPAAWQPVPVLDHVQAVAAGYFDILAVREDSSLWGWSARYPGQWLPSFPVPVAGLRGITAIASGGAHALAIQSRVSE
jgi:alpha-tubulin suppressor-like RCC1 family protein